MGALYKGLIVTGVLSIGALALVISQVLPAGFGVLDGAATALGLSGEITGMDLFLCGLLGLVVTGLIVGSPNTIPRRSTVRCKSVAKASESGHGTNVIQGLAVSLESTALPALTIIAGIIATYNLAGLYGVAIATTTMLALAGMIVALDAFGPVTDNAGGIAEMAELAIGSP
jgi:K(+)-stimulated pyrophosphate-energized sodium pump